MNILQERAEDDFNHQMNKEHTTWAATTQTKAQWTPSLRARARCSALAVTNFSEQKKEGFILSFHTDSVLPNRFYSNDVIWSSASTGSLLTS